MQKIIYGGAIILLFIIVTVGMWFFSVGRDLNADKEYFHQAMPPRSK